MSNRIKQQKKQSDREEKMLEQIRKGNSTRVEFQIRKEKVSLPNRVNMLSCTADEVEAKQEMIEDTVKVYRKMLPGLLQKLSRIPDHRHVDRIKHKHTVLLLYGILMFVLQIGSRREVNRSMDRITFENLQNMFPELETMPHADTLARFLEVTDVEEIQNSMIEMLKGLIRKKKFKNLLVKGNYLIAIDGTQKMFRDYKLDDNCLNRHVGEEKKLQYYVYVLESVLVLGNGVTLPLMSEFLKNENYVEGVSKQDCERKAFIRLAQRIKEVFPKMKITLLVDGLYACGPVINTCRKNGWGYMITLKEGSLPEVWDDAMSLMRIAPENSKCVTWGGRTQEYAWANDIEYEYGENRILRETVHVAYCRESWEERHSRSTGRIEKKSTRYCWLSSVPLSSRNIFERCTRMGRYRWMIENNILTEKHQGYEYEHCYSYTWNAMEGYHYLMKIGRFLNVMAANSEILNERVKKYGIRGFIDHMNRIISGSLLDAGGLQKAVSEKHQFKLVY